MLHLISNSRFDLAILQRVSHGDIVVFLDDAVLSVFGRRALENMRSDVKCYVLIEHLQIYGMVEADLMKGIEVIDYTFLVNLTVGAALIQTWS